MSKSDLYFHIQIKLHLGISSKIFAQLPTINPKLGCIQIYKASEPWVATIPSQDGQITSAALYALFSTIF